LKKFDVKEHTKKYYEISKKAGNGTFPNKKIAKAGSVVGLGIGGVLIGVGIIGVATGSVYGLGACIAGITTGASNIYNLKRIKRNSSV
jgi:hypothetical protein